MQRILFVDSDNRVTELDDVTWVVAKSESLSELPQNSFLLDSFGLYPLFQPNFLKSSSLLSYVS